MLEMLVEKEMTLRNTPLKPQLSPSLHQESLLCWSLENFQDEFELPLRMTPSSPALPSQQSLSSTIHTEKSWDYFFCLHFVCSCVATDSTATSSLSQTSAAACLSLQALYCSCHSFPPDFLRILSICLKLGSSKPGVSGEAQHALS